MNTTTGFPSDSTPDDLRAIIKGPNSRKHLQAPSWFRRINEENAEGFLIDRIIENLSHNITGGVIELTAENHLTVEKITQKDAYKDAVKNQKREFTFELKTTNLPAFRPYIEFVPKLGGIGVKKLRFEYVAQPVIAAEDVRVTLLNEHLEAVSIAALDASIEMSMLVNGKEVPLGPPIQRRLSLHRKLGQVASPSQAVDNEEKPCGACGARIPANARFCRRCGARQRETQNPET